MNANAFRHFYDYHFAENRKIWDRYVTLLSHERFTQPVRLLPRVCPGSNRSSHQRR